jgi:hypothetical protein
MSGNSTWIFTCKLGLAQETCNTWTPDLNSRGLHRLWDGCPSCSHRLAYGDETRRAEEAWQNRELAGQAQS